MDRFEDLVHDTPEQIRMCLNCEKDECDDCIGRRADPKKPEKRHIPDLKNRVKAGVLSGESDAAIAGMLHIPVTTVGRCRRSMGLTRQRSGGAHDAELRSLHARGMTDREMADALGISVKAVFGIRKKLGLACHFSASRGGDRRSAQFQAKKTAEARADDE